MQKFPIWDIIAIFFITLLFTILTAATTCGGIALCVGSVPRHGVAPPLKAAPLPSLLRKLHSPENSGCR
jgi:hypothetical protein